MTVQKRLFDLIFVVLLGLILGPIILLLCGLLLVKQGRPIFYAGERMTTPDKGFRLWKFRTMTNSDVNAGVSGGDKSNRITPIGAKLRKYRLDELPQLWNIFVGDVSFVGPRPPLREYVDFAPEVYARVLQSRPGVTGLATIVIHDAEARVLSKCQTAAETDRVYREHFIPRKAKLDLIYQRNASVCFDIEIIWKTVSGVFGR